MDFLWSPESPPRGERPWSPNTPPKWCRRSGQRGIRLHPEGRRAKYASAQIRDAPAGRGVRGAFEDGAREARWDYVLALEASATGAPHAVRLEGTVPDGGPQASPDRDPYDQKSSTGRTLGARPAACAPLTTGVYPHWSDGLGQDRPLRAADTGRTFQQTASGPPESAARRGLSGPNAGVTRRSTPAARRPFKEK